MCFGSADAQVVQKTHSPRLHGADSPVLHNLCSPVYVVELDWYPDAPGEMVVLTCDTPEEEGITWTSDQSSEVLGSGKTLTIQVKEFGDAGQYTCHKEGKILSQSLLLLHKKEDGIWSTDILKDQKGNSIPLDDVSFLFCSIRDTKIKKFKEMINVVNEVIKSLTETTQKLHFSLLLFSFARYFGLSTIKISC